MLAGRNSSAVIDTNLNTSTVTQCELASACSTDEHGLGHRRQSSASVSVTVNITGCVSWDLEKQRHTEAVPVPLYSSTVPQLQFGVLQQT